MYLLKESNLVLPALSARVSSPVDEGGMDWEYVFASVAQLPKKATSLTWTDRTVKDTSHSPIPITRLEHV